MTVLRSEAVDRQEGGESIRLIGLDDLGVYCQALSGDSSDRQALSAAKEALKRDLSTLAEGSGYALVLSHRPELIDLYAECGADLVLRVNNRPEIVTITLRRAD